MVNDYEGEDQSPLLPLTYVRYPLELGEPSGILKIPKLVSQHKLETLW